MNFSYILIDHLFFMIGNFPWHTLLSWNQTIINSSIVVVKISVQISRIKDKFKVMKYFCYIYNFSMICFVITGRLIGCISRNSIICMIPLCIEWFYDSWKFSTKHNIYTIILPIIILIYYYASFFFVTLMLIKFIALRPNNPLAIYWNITGFMNLWSYWIMFLEKCSQHKDREKLTHVYLFILYGW